MPGEVPLVLLGVPLMLPSQHDWHTGGPPPPPSCLVHPLTASAFQLAELKERGLPDAAK